MPQRQMYVISAGENDGGAVIVAGVRSKAPAFAVILALCACASLPGSETETVGEAKLDALYRPGPAPTVVFESGIGAYKEGWTQVIALLGGDHALFAYDRPGIGGSSPTSRPRDGISIVEDLRLWLAHSGAKPPYVLVGHSVGGLYAQVFARQHPDEVAGLVLVDPTHPTQFEGAGSLEKRGLVAEAAMGAAALLGPVRAEFDALPETGREMLAAPPLPERIPVAILVAPDRSNTEIAAFDNAKRADYAQLYPKASFREVEGGHQIPIEHPETVAEAVRVVMTAAPR